MGYETYHTLEILEGNDHSTNHKKEIGELAGYEYLFDDDCKWYDHEEDMLFYSKKHPSTVFELLGEGEETGDLWRKYFKNGKMQICRAKIEYDEYDINKLV